MSMKKTVSIPMETTAYYQEISKLNVRFWSQDKGTAELRFLITRNNFPLSLSKEHVKIILALESEGSFISTDDLNIDNEIEGVVTYVIPSSFMAVAKDVTGQIYVTTLDGDEIVVQRKFSFKVEDDLLSTIPSEEKIRYIKMFDDLRVDMEARLGTLDTALSQLEANVDAVNNARENGIAAINNLYNAKLITFNQNFDDKMLAITNATTELNDYVDNSLADMTQKKNEFDDAVLGSGLVTESSTSDWQKYKLTQDDGTRTYLPKGSFEDVHELEPGYYETVSNDTPTQGFPLEFANAAFIEIDVTKSSSESGRKQIQVTQSSRPQTFVKYIHTGGVDDNGWKEIPYVNADNPFETVSGSQSKANVAENNAKVYADEKISALHKVLFTGSVNGVGNNVVLGDNYNNFDEIVLFYSTLGGRDSKVVKAKESSQIVIHSFNLTNSDGGNGDIFETVINRVNGTTLKISNEVRFNLLNQTGGSTSGITITEIIGVKY